jgi:hypothetical protein
VREKFRRLVGNAGMPGDQMEEILRRIESFEGLAGPSELTELLQLPAGNQAIRNWHDSEEGRLIE